MIGHSIGPYHIIDKLGQGGMGEVYRARDTRLHRDVALKVLPAVVAQDVSRRERFEHEARVVAALNHPNILQVFDVGNADGVSYIVTELLGGTSLRNASLPIRKIVEVGAQIADGLASAHSVGVIHRDLKPENVIVTPDGRAKILDFGLAKVAVPVTGPTMVETQPGVVMGTVGYMSPEQVRGVEVDHRSDIFSFGAVLYELLTGKRAFTGETAAEVMTSILRHDAPDLPENVPTSLRLIVNRCLEKQPDERFQSARDLAFALRQFSGASMTSSGAAPIVAARAKPLIRWWPVAAALAVGTALGTAVTLWSAAQRDETIDPIQLTRLTSEPATERDPAFSPDGQLITYVRATGTNSEIVVSPIDAPRPVVVARSAEPLGFPFWHPDGTKICYVTRLRELWCVSAAGGPPQRVLEGPGYFARGNQSFLFVSIEKGRRRLFTSSPPGAEPKPVDTVTLPESASALSVSPDGAKLLVVARDGLWLVRYPAGGSTRMSLSADTTILSTAWFTDSRHILVSERTSGLRAYRLLIFDTASGARRLVRHDTGAIISTALSRNGKRIAYSSGEPDWDIAEYSMDGKPMRSGVRSGGLDTNPAWSPRAERFAYMVSGSGTRASLRMRNLDGSDEVILAANLGIPVQPRFSPDGQRIAYSDASSVYAMPATGGPPVRIVSTELSVTRLCWSPDGEWLWYQEGSGVWKVPSQGGQTTLIQSQGATLADCSPTGEVLIGTAGVGAQIVAPDGKVIRVLSSGPLSGAGVAPQFGEAGRVLYAVRADRRSLDVLDVMTTKPLRTITFDLDSGDAIGSFSVHPDGKRVLLQVGGLRYDLWLAEGFAQPVIGWRRWFRHWDVQPLPAGATEVEYSDVTD